MGPSRRAIRYPAADVPAAGTRVTAAHRGGWRRSMGSVSKPSAYIPRRVIIVAPAYNGVPSRAAMNMPEPPVRSVQGKNGWGYLRRFGEILDTHEWDRNDTDGLHAVRHAGPVGFGVPPLGNITPPPVYRPPAPIVESLSLRPNLVPDRVSRMHHPRQLRALLPNVNNLYEPPRYGVDPVPGAPTPGGLREAIHGDTGVAAKTKKPRRQSRTARRVNRPADPHQPATHMPSAHEAIHGHPDGTHHGRRTPRVTRRRR